jgi:hypothetical protein
MPNFCILDWSVVRFTPKRAAAPEAPPTTHLASCKARKIWSRSASLKPVIREATESLLVCSSLMGTWESLIERTSET